MKINKVTMIGNTQVFKSNAKKQSTNIAQTNNSINSLMNADASASLKAGISFKRQREEMTHFEQSIFRKDELRVPDLFNMPEDIHIAFQDMNTKDEKAINPAGLNIVSTQTEDKKVINITNDKGDLIFTGEVKNGTQAPTLTYKQGKFMPEITIKDPSLNGKSVKMLAGSHVKGDGFELFMPGSF